MKPSTWLNVFLVLALAGLVAAGLWWRSAETVSVTPVRRGLAVRAVPAVVTVRAEHALELRSEAPGRVKTSALAVGRRVQAGELLVQLDDADAQLERERTLNELAAAKKRRAVGSATRLALETARENLAAFAQQTETGGYAPAELEKRRREVKQLEQHVALEDVAEAAQLAALETELKVRERALAKARIESPLDGEVASVAARPGDLIAEGAPVATILSRERVVEARISEENFAGVQVGQRVTVRFLGYAGEEFPGVIAKVSPAADPVTQRYTVFLDLKIAPERLVPGLSGEASIVLAERAGALIVPRRALGGNDVFLVEAGRVVRREVKRGHESLGEVEILDGLREGDTVITDGLDLVKPGQRVRSAGN